MFYYVIGNISITNLTIENMVIGKKSLRHYYFNFSTLEAIQILRDIFRGYRGARQSVTFNFFVVLRTFNEFGSKTTFESKIRPRKKLNSLCN
jgi:hypothetical protein